MKNMHMLFISCLLWSLLVETLGRSMLDTPSIIASSLFQSFKSFILHKRKYKGGCWAAIYGHVDHHHGRCYRTKFRLRKDNLNPQMCDNSGASTHCHLR
jgi:hypothetical protein